MSRVEFERIKKVSDALQGVEILSALIGEDPIIQMSDKALELWEVLQAEYDNFYKLSLDERVKFSEVNKPEHAAKNTTKNQVIHKWFGGHSGQLIEELGADKVYELAAICERRRGDMYRRGAMDTLSELRSKIWVQKRPAEEVLDEVFAKLIKEESHG